MDECKPLPLGAIKGNEETIVMNIGSELKMVGTCKP